MAGTLPGWLTCIYVAFVDYKLLYFTCRGEYNSLEQYFYIEVKQMIGIIVASHGTLASQLIKSSEFICGELNNVDFVHLDESGVELFRERLLQLVHKAHAVYDHILFLVDLKDGTPYNELSRLIYSGICSEDRLVSGVNLAMLMEAAISSTDVSSIDELVAAAVETGRSNIAPMVITEVAEDSDDENL